jgi:hypothetical protein
MQEIASTIYHNMGIDPSVTRLMDPAGRPQQLVDHTDPIREIV